MDHVTYFMNFGTHAWYVFYLFIYSYLFYLFIYLFIHQSTSAIRK